MGAKKNRLAAFLAAHPMCCFCGGSAPATTQDHIPPRGVFRDKKWPEHYVFPACQVCNNGSARDDALVAFLSRMNMEVRDGTPEAQEWSKCQQRFGPFRFGGDFSGDSRFPDDRGERHVVCVLLVRYFRQRFANLHNLRYRAA